MLTASRLAEAPTESVPVETAIDPATRTVFHRVREGLPPALHELPPSSLIDLFDESSSVSCEIPGRQGAFSVVGLTSLAFTCGRVSVREPDRQVQRDVGRRPH